MPILEVFRFPAIRFSELFAVVLGACPGNTHFSRRLNTHNGWCRVISLFLLLLFPAAGEPPGDPITRTAGSTVSESALPASTRTALVYESLFRLVSRMRQNVKDRAVFERMMYGGLGYDRKSLAVLESVIAKFFAEMDSIDSQAATIHEAARNEARRTGVVPPLPEELKRLQARRIDAVLNHRQMLRDSLGPLRFAELDGPLEARLSQGAISRSESRQ